MIILDTFPDLHTDPHEEQLLKEKDEVREGKVMMINFQALFGLEKPKEKEE